MQKKERTRQLYVKLKKSTRLIAPRTPHLSSDIIIIIITIITTALHYFSFLHLYVRETGNLVRPLLEFASAPTSKLTYRAFVHLWRGRQASRRVKEQERDHRIAENHHHRGIIKFLLSESEVQKTRS